MTSARDEFEEWMDNYSDGGIHVSGIYREWCRDAWQASRADLTQLVRDYRTLLEECERFFVVPVPNSGGASYQKDLDNLEDAENRIKAMLSESRLNHGELFKAVGAL